MVRGAGLAQGGPAGSPQLTCGEIERFLQEAKIGPLKDALDLNMVPPYVERKMGRRSASLTWWIDDTIDELDRIRQKKDPPDPEDWNKQMQAVRVFDQLIHNTDDNLDDRL